MAVAAGAVFAFTTASAQSGTAVTFTTIPAQKLGAVGIVLTAPQGPTPAAAAGEAAAIAATRALGNKVLEYKRSRSHTMMPIGKVSPLFYGFWRLHKVRTVV